MKLMYTWTSQPPAIIQPVSLKKHGQFPEKLLYVLLELYIMKMERTYES